jgi:isopenicillin-N epimerase
MKMTSLKELFLLDPTVVFLNHGSFGACPRPVFNAYQEWQRRLEAQPVQFIGRELIGYLRTARQRLGDYVGAAANDLVYVPNATFGVNVVARSLPLGPGDEVLATDHEYGANDRLWRFLSRKQAFTYVRQPVDLPVTSRAEMVEQIWQGVTDRTRLIFISHITSFTALRLPVEEICRRAAAAGILTLVDGAHAPGQIPLDMAAIGADFYTGNAHKWLNAPKGAAFLYARPQRQALLEPLIVSWGWEAEKPGDSRFIDHQEWLGTNDPAAYLAVPAAIQFQADHEWTAVRQQSHELVQQAIQRIETLTGLPSLYGSDSSLYHQMAVASLPPLDDLMVLKNRLYDEYKVEIPCFPWQQRQLIRVSAQGYNSQSDIDALIEALTTLLSVR